MSRYRRCHGTLNRTFPPKVVIIEHCDNLGTSGAVHSGMKYALEYHYDWIWVFDGDSAPRPSRRTQKSRGRQDQATNITNTDMTVRETAKMDCARCSGLVASLRLGDAHSRKAFSLLLVPALGVILWSAVLPARALGPIPNSGMLVKVQSSASGGLSRVGAGNESPPTVAWIDELRNALGRYIWTHPDASLTPYLETLTVVRESVGRGDRRTVKLEMETYFGMLAIHARGISDDAAKELSASAVRLTPAQAYGISIPASLRR